MKSVKRWEDLVALVVGAYALLSPLWTSTDTAAMWSLIVLGALIGLAALASIARPEMEAMEYVYVALGILMFIAPWVLAYSDLMGAAWTSWIVGVIAAVVGLTELPAVRHIGRPAAQH